MIKRLLHLALLVIVFASNIGAIPAGAQTPSPEPGAGLRPIVVRIQYKSREQLDALAATLDIWEVHPEQHTIIAQVWPEQYALLVSQGVQVSVDEQRSNFPETIPNFPCYRTIVELYARLDELAATYPGLVQLVTIGHSYENRPLQVLKITNKSTGGVKPRFFLMANIHGRELITPETAMVFIEYLTGNYGSNADVTWLLDYHEIYVLVSANPDGHVKNEPGNVPWSYWRKNTRPDLIISCFPTTIGVDLNRNHSFKWGSSFNGSSDYPCDETYRGISPASESEVAAIQSYVSSLFPDQRGPDDNDAAPDTTTGVLISLHSYSNLVLWPWGWEQVQAPNYTQLRDLGEKFASYNGYTPEQAFSLYATDGTSDDWSYGELGIASYTFEMGSSGFYPSCNDYDLLIQPNIPALIYAAKVARTPYMTPQGPDALAITITAAVSGTMPVVSAAINDSTNGANPITAAEYYIDLPPWAGGSPVSMQASDGNFNQVEETVAAELATGGLGLGRHMIFVRGRDNTAMWGPVSAVYYSQMTDSQIRGEVTNAANGDPLAGAQVTLHGNLMTAQAFTNGQGDYFADVISGTYTTTVTLFRYAAQVVSGIVATTHMTTTLDFSLSSLATGTLEGVVHDAMNNSPLQATIVISGTPVSLDSDPLNGTFSTTLPIGTYTLMVSAPDYSDLTQAGLQINAGEVTNAQLYLSRLPLPIFLPLIRAGGT